ncbi:DUF4886 domain-containing protein [Sphingobacterium corticibacterium]|nr:DUF4886 domain-containing protein [Sphingobacterium corticibacterium]
MIKFVKIFIFTLFAASLLLSISCEKDTVEEDKKEQPKEVAPTVDDGILKILTIGNSFSEDAVENYLYDLMREAEIPVVIGNLYIGSSSLDIHWQNGRNNSAAYDFRRIDTEGKKTNASSTLGDALESEEWDYISFQQASPYSGLAKSYEAHLPPLYEYVKPRTTNTDVKFILHQTWAYAQNSTHEGFAHYDRDQLHMYNAIVDAIEKARGFVPIDLVVPVGTAIQNGRASFIGDNFTRDGWHLDLNIGRYTAACTWFEALTGKNVTNSTFKPAALSEYTARLARAMAHQAILKPNEMTELQEYKDGNYQPFTDPVYIDFGQNAPALGWNQLRGFTTGSSLSNIMDIDGVPIGLSLTLTMGFNGRNDAGERNTNTDFNMPESVSGDSYFGNSKAIFDNKLVERSQIKIAGFDKNKTYDFCFFGSRSGVGGTENREAKYTVAGKNEKIARLNASNNRQQLACVQAIAPDDEGEITITLMAGESNTNGNGFYYINAMRIAPSE